MLQDLSAGNSAVSNLSKKTSSFSFSSESQVFRDTSGCQTCDNLKLIKPQILSTGLPQLAPFMLPTARGSPCAFAAQAPAPAPQPQH